ncbi:hypothetical protein M2165_004844 [Variovorax sp. TBS-050B]|uniref:hypothetical protein n=1 Tax=Variovorax sp. TBS-050B TaxID=2940551 RepID=UPI0024754A69|nr:hypothetical protein [Variovorax sp. TBS-050B]MDH6594955.1 hypothetical protein [Variovorax sp. TBS-050B]
MLVHARDIARACVAATSLRRNHPDWFQWLFVHDTPPAPWEDFAAGIFDARMATPELPPPAKPSAHGSRSTNEPWRTPALLERAFAAPFEAGADVVICVDACHVWMKPWPSLQTALDSHEIVIANAGLVAARRSTHPERLSAAIGQAFRDDFGPSSSMHDFFVLDDAGFGFDRARHEELPLRFAPDGSLRQGDLPIITVDFRGSATTEFEARCGLPAFGTEWVELTKWYAGQLKRFGDADGAADQLRRGQPG